MCLQAQGINDNNGVVNRVRRAYGLDNDDGGFSRGRGRNDATKGSETTTEASRIQGRRRRLRICNDRPEELATTTEASAEEDEPKVLTMTTEASDEESEDTTYSIERIRRWRRRCVYGLRVLTTRTAALSD